VDTRHAQELLARERARVQSALDAISSQPDGQPDDPFEASDAGQGLVDEELEQARDEQLRNELESIERAERRIAEGIYGLSVDSGEPIPDARLEAVPWAERTAEEQALFESRG
jgi:DnaK suppressor protein